LGLTGTMDPSNDIREYWEASIKNPRKNRKEILKLNIKTKCTNILLVAALMCTMIVMQMSHASVANAYTDTSDMTNEAFFGVWNGSSWTTAGKLNYSYSGGALSSVESAVKAGNYTSAKTALFNYFKARNNVVTNDPGNPGVLEQLIADMAIDNILYNSGKETPITTFTVGNTAQTHSIDVTQSVTDSMAIGAVAYELMSWTAVDPMFTFNSKEAAGNKPVLSVVISGQTYNLNPADDTYVRGSSAYANSNYGSNTALVIKQQNNPELERRTFLKFDLSSLTGVPSSATLKLYGSNTAGTGDHDIILFQYNDISWDEDTLTFANMNSYTFSWQGVATGSNWNLPNYGTDVKYLNIHTRLNFVDDTMSVYKDTDDEKYAQGAIELLLDFIGDKGSAYGDNTEVPGGYSNNLATAYRVKRMLNAFNYLVKNSASMDANACTAMLKNIWVLGNFLNHPSSFNPGNNWGSTQSASLNQIAVTFPEFSSASAWESTSTTRLEQMFDSLLKRDGSYKEASTMYTGVGTSGFSAPLKFSELNGKTYSKTYKDKLAQIYTYYMDTTLPDLGDAGYGDSDYTANHASYLSTAAGIYPDRNDFKYVSTGGALGTAPDYTSKVWRTKVEAVLRSGWDEDDLYMHINDGNGNHGHHDNMGLIAYAYGKRLLIDSGRFAYIDEDPRRQWLVSTEAHNTIEIGNNNSNESVGQVKRFATTELYDFVEFKDTGAYTTANLSSNITQFRSVLFLKPNYWIVSDYLTDSGTASRTYEQKWHMLPDAAITLDAATKKVKTNYSNDANIQVVPADPGSITAQLRDGYFSDEEGTISENVKYASLHKTASNAVTFDTVLYPTDAQDTNRNVKVTRLTTSPNVASTVATALKIELDSGNNGNIGYYYLSHESDTTALTARTFDGYNGRLAYVETDYSNNLTFALMKQGKVLKSGTTNIIEHDSEIEDMGVKWSGTTLEIYGPSLQNDTSTGTAVAIYAPSAISVKLNGQTISHTKSGNYVYAVKPSVRENAKTNWANVKSLGSGHTGTVTAEFDVIPKNDDSAGMIAYCDSSVTPSAPSDCAIFVQLSSDGLFKSRDGGTDSYDTYLKYVADHRYHVKVVANMNTKKYSVYVTPEGGGTVTLAYNYDFRSGAPVTDDMGKAAFQAINSNNVYYVENHIVYSP
jgi:hypothetical protein